MSETGTDDPARVPDGASVGDDVDAGSEQASDGIPRSARALVAIVLALLLIPGVIGFDLWPLTGWRLFSLSRDAEQTRWVIEATLTGGEERVVSLEELPLRYRHAEWPMRELDGGSEERSEDICQALLEPVVDVEPDTVELTVAKDDTRLVHRGDEWVTLHDLDPVYSCRPAGGAGS